MVEQIKKLRREVDYLLRRGFEIHRSTRDVIKETNWSLRASISIRLAKAWLGESLKGLTENPYPAADTPSQIPAEVDVVNDPLLLSGDLLKDINRQREQLSDVIRMIQESGLNAEKQKAIDYLTEARFFYGFQLGDIRE